MPWPFLSPGFASPENVYTGWPFTTTCFVPSARVSTVTGSPAMVLGGVPVAVSGGHRVSQPALHALVVAESGLNAYRVLPSLLTISLSSPTCATLNTAAFDP